MAALRVVVGAVATCSIAAMAAPKGDGALTRTRKRALRARRKLAYKLTSRSSDRHALVGDAWLAAMKRRFQFKFLTSRGLRPEHRLLDVGCGTLRGGVAFIEYLEPGHYIGVESRAKVLEEGRRELVEAGLEHKQPVLINAADPADIQLDGQFDFAWAFSVLFHMPDDVVDAYLGFISGGLSDGGEFYANVMLGDGPEQKWSGTRCWNAHASAISSGRHRTAWKSRRSARWSPSATARGSTATTR